MLHTICLYYLMTILSHAVQSVQQAKITLHFYKKTTTVHPHKMTKNPCHSVLSFWAVLICIISSVNMAHTFEQQPRGLLNNKGEARIENQRLADWKLKDCKMSVCSNREREREGGRGCERAYYAWLLITLPWLSQASWLENRSPWDKTHS